MKMISNIHNQKIRMIILSFFIISSCDDKNIDAPSEPILFLKTYGGSESDLGYSVQQTSDGGYIITGRTNSFGSGNWDIWLIKTDAQGSEEWSQTYGGDGSDQGRAVRQTSDGGYIITGSSSSFGSGNDDIWLIKTDAQGNTTLLSK